MNQRQHLIRGNLLGRMRRQSERLRSRLPRAGLMPNWSQLIEGWMAAVPQMMDDSDRLLVVNQFFVSLLTRTATDYPNPVPSYALSQGSKAHGSGSGNYYPAGDSGIS